MLVRSTNVLNIVRALCVLLRDNRPLKMVILGSADLLAIQITDSYVVVDYNDSASY
jgi:hypothetical protein